MAERNKIGYIHYDEAQTQAQAPSSRRKIGYIRYDDEVATATEEVATNEKELQIPMSNSQVFLINNIGSLAEKITSEQFASFPMGMRDAIVSQLIEFVSLNAEINIKTQLSLETIMGGR